MNAATAGKRSTPFAPGFGTRPDYVAGRKAEFRRLEDNLHDIAENRQKDGRLPYTPPSPIVLVGPRGVGKTLLLGWVEEQAVAKGLHVVCLEQMRHSPEDGMAKELIEAIAGDEDETFWQSVEGANLSLGGFGAGFKRELAAKGGFRKVFEAKLKKQPMVLLMDEVQHYHAESLGMVMQASQRFIKSKYPLMVILAGTPDMNSLLMNIKASFMIRGEKMPINLLEDDDVREGLKNPFAAHGIEVEEKALQKMQSLTDGYPYFIQTVGHAVWDTLQNEKEEGKRKIVDLPLVEKAIVQMDKRRKMFYSDLSKEMHDGDLLACAKRVAGFIKSKGNQPVSRAMLEAELEQMDKELLPDKGAKEIVGILEDRGFLWPDAGGFLGPGIPSFLNFLEKMSTREAQIKNYSPPARDNSSEI